MTDEREAELDFARAVVAHEEQQLDVARGAVPRLEVKLDKMRAYALLIVHDTQEALVNARADVERREGLVNRARGLVAVLADGQGN